MWEIIRKSKATNWRELADDVFKIYLLDNAVIAEGIRVIAPDNEDELNNYLLARLPNLIFDLVDTLPLWIRENGLESCSELVGEEMIARVLRQCPWCMPNLYHWDDFRYLVALRVFEDAKARIKQQLDLIGGGCKDEE